MKEHSKNRLEEILNKLPESELSTGQLQEILNKIRNIKVNVLLIGGTGVGKSSTINALFSMDKAKISANAKIGHGVTPETKEIQKYELENIILWDTPGLGDNENDDDKYKKMIVAKLQEEDDDKNALIDLVLLILDAGSRDYSSAFTLIKEVIVQNLKGQHERLLIGINQADLAMKGKGWNIEKNQPDDELIRVLEEKVIDAKIRILKSSGIDTEPVYYSAGYSYKDDHRNPYNMEKLLNYILKRLPEKKRFVILNDLNSDEDNFKDNDSKNDYKSENEGYFGNSFFSFLTFIGTAIKSIYTFLQDNPDITETIKEFFKGKSSRNQNSTSKEKHRKK